MGMNKIHRKVEYALIALKIMAKKGLAGPTSAKEICAATDIPFDATSRVMQLMVQKGILHSEHGAYGGYRIARDLESVSFYEVMEAVLGPLEIVKCVNGEACELSAKCVVQSPLQELNRRVRQFYQSLPVGELLQIEKVWETQTPRNI